MNILMVTNTFTPNVSGVARSVAAFTEEYRRRGHRVLVVAPTFRGAQRQETDVIRIRALKNFNGSDYSVVLSPPRRLARAVEEFQADIIHAHSPFLLGTTAARLARQLGVPLVFTHHTLYELYTHYIPGDSKMLKRLAIRRATRFANQSNAVFAPSRSLADMLNARRVTTPIHIVPTGVDLEQFRNGDSARFRASVGIASDAPVVGYVGRLAEEKNLTFLARSIGAFLNSMPRARALFVGEGPSREEIRRTFVDSGVADRVVFAGVRHGNELVDAYHAIDVFTFASSTETQGLVLAEAMAAGVPVVAVDAPGVREMVADGVNGRLLPTADVATFRDAITSIFDKSAKDRAAMTAAARETAGGYSIELVTDKALAAYAALTARSQKKRAPKRHRMRRLLRGEWPRWASPKNSVSQF